MMRIRYLGHSCVEIVGVNHILIDPDFTREPLPQVEYICISHAHRDHIGRIAEVPEGTILASPQVCDILLEKGIPSSRMRPVIAGEQIENIEIYPGYSIVNDPVYFLMSLMFRFRRPDPGGVPLSFFIRDDADLLHIGDAHRFPVELHPDIFCLPWRKSPINSSRYTAMILAMVNQLSAPYLLPIHHDLPGTEADPADLAHHVDSYLLLGENWHEFKEKSLLREG